MIQSNGKPTGPRISELGHLDTHSPADPALLRDGSRCHLVGIMDEQTRLAWAEVVEAKDSLSIMFAALKIVNFFSIQYGLRFRSILTNEKPELACRENVDEHPVERMLKELHIEHRYTRRPGFRDNGKIKRLWRTVNEEFLARYNFESTEELQYALEIFFVEYNTVRPHEALGYLTPAKALESL